MSRIVALSGGVGGAKLVLGLARAMDGKGLSVIANTGDDFEHFGLHVSPDIDTLVYTLAGLAHAEQGWGRQDETWSFLETLADLGGDAWFRLGDRDLAMHVLRTARLRAGETLSTVTAAIAKRLGVGCALIPMSDAPAPTMLETDEGVLAFQDYFVRRRCAPRVRALRLGGAAPSPGFAALLADAAVDAFILCPSNPFLSMDPILALNGVRAALQAHGAPVVAVTPIVSGQAIKGPTAKIFRELGVTPSATAVARRYLGCADAFILDERDASLAAEIEDMGYTVIVAQTVMRTLEDRVALARAVSDVATRLRARI